MESYSEGYFYKMLHYIRDFIDTGLKEKRFTQKEAEHDLQIALWVSYACNNIDEYEYYYTSVRWLADVEDLAQGCGVWFYRYSSALMYCGRLTEALVYAEKASWKNLIIRGAGCSWQNCAAILEIRKAHCQRTIRTSSGTW